MPKTIEKPAVKATAKKAAPRKAREISKEVLSSDLLKKVNQETLKKLKSLDASKELQADIEWCLGSYDYDKNPSGLFETAKKALVYFREEKIKNSKVIPAKLITDLEKATKDSKS